MYIERNNQIESFYTQSLTTKFDIYISDEIKKKLHTTVCFNRLTFGMFCVLDEVEDLFVERQHIFCSKFKPKSQRLHLEEQIRKKISEYMIISRKIYSKTGRNMIPTTSLMDLKEALAEDVSCASCLTYLWTGDQRRNGGLFWDFLHGLRSGINHSFTEGKIKNVRE